MSDLKRPAPQIPPRRYFGVHYILLRFLGLGWWHHPDERDTRNFPGLYIYYTILTEVVWVAGFVTLESIDPFVGETDKDRIMFSISFVITHDLTVIKLFIFLFKNNAIQDIVHTLTIDLQNFYQNQEKNRRTIKITRILTATFVFFGWMTIANISAYGIVQDIIWKAEVKKINDTVPPRTLPQSIYIPWSYQRDGSYILTFLLETVGLLWTGHIVLIIDTFIASVILHMSSQFEILQEAIITAYDRTIEHLTNEINRDIDDTLTIGNSHNTDVYYERIVRTYRTEQEIENALENTLKNCFRQHQMLIRIPNNKENCYWYVQYTKILPYFQMEKENSQDAQNCLTTRLTSPCTDRVKSNGCVEKFATTYSYGFMTQLLSSMAAICVIMVQLSQDASSLKSIRLASSLAFFAVMIIQLALQCFTSNELTYQAGLVAEAVMACKWERMPPRFRRLLTLMTMRAQRPLKLTAAGFATLDNSCFLSIIKAAYSYYAVLSQKQGS